MASQFDRTSFQADSHALNRVTRGVTWLLIAVSCGMVVARILVCHSPDPKRPVPFMSANDRSRWCTVHSLVDYGTFAIDPVIDGKNGQWWDTIDKVRHAGPDGLMHSYSSKPVLWPTLLAGQYWLIQKATGWTMENDLFNVVRLMLIINNVIGLGLLLWFLGRVAEMVTEDAWARCFVVAAGSLATYLTSFSVTLNNHLPAATLVAMSLWLALMVMRSQVGWFYFFALGLIASSAAYLELPAAGWLAICSVIAFSRAFGKSLGGFVPGVLIVAAGLFGVNYLAHDDWRPPYAHRTDGPVVAKLTGDFATDLDAGTLPQAFVDAIDTKQQQMGFAVDIASSVAKRTGGMIPSSNRQWVVNIDRPSQFIVEQTSEDGFNVRRWDNWYDFPGSYWRQDNERKSNIDRGESDQWKYLLHSTVGHHGALSLTPIFLLSLLGVLPLCFVRRNGFRFLGLATLALTVVVFAFYMTREEMDRNYGGMTSGLRWVFWLYPLWLIWMIPTLEWASRRFVLMLMCLILLAISVASACYAIDNPWVHPWLYEWMAARGYEV